MIQSNKETSIIIEFINFDEQLKLISTNFTNNKYEKTKVINNYLLLKHLIFYLLSKQYLFLIDFLLIKFIFSLKSTKVFSQSKDKAAMFF